MITRLLIVASVVGVLTIFGVLTNLAYPGFSQKQVERVTSLGDSILNNIYAGQGNVARYSSNALNKVGGMFSNAKLSVGRAMDGVSDAPSKMAASVEDGFDGVMTVVQKTYLTAEESVFAFFDFDMPDLTEAVAWPQFANNNIYQNDASDKPSVADLLAGIEPATGGNDIDVSDNPPSDFGYEYAIEDEELISEAVLVPQAKTVISSSRDGKIKKINFKNGDHFKKGDIILEYHCDDVQAELEAVSLERKFARQKQLTTSRLFNMDLSSKLEVEQSHVEKHQAQAKKKVVETRINDCRIRADYDGHVVKRMANDNEYTRTDRVLMEVAAKDVLDVEFLLPSKSLRWVNIDAPITITVNETDREYTGVIKQIYGEVDPVSQSIQIRAGLDEYQEPLLPGMSGRVTIDVRGVRQAGIAGFLETKIQ